MASIADEVRAEMLAALLLSEPQSLSNVDLAKLYKEDGALEPNLTPAEYYHRLLIAARDD